VSYVDAGYAIVLSTLVLYGVQLVWRRRRLARVVARVRSGDDGGTERQAP
jgi:heme exporter protein D